MTTARYSGDVPARARLERFDGPELALHWVNAGLFGLLIVTAAILYFGPLSALVGRRGLVRYVHVVCGLALPFPLIAARLGPWRQAFVADVRALARFDDDDRRWLRSLRSWGRKGKKRRQDIRMGKFHPGQKLNAAFTLGAVLVMVATGSIMHWFKLFPVEWRTGATFVHDWLAITLAVVIAGHIKMALSDSDARRGMTEGWVPTIWARRHRPKWYEEMTGRASEPGRSGPPPVKS